MDLQVFFAENVVSEKTEEVVISERFQQEGEPVKWKIRALTEETNAELKKTCTKRDKKGRVDVDQNAYVTKLAVEGTVFPNLRDAELQKSYGVMGADKLIKKMLLAGEFAFLAEKIGELSGFDREFSESVEEAKN